MLIQTFRDQGGFLREINYFYQDFGEDFSLAQTFYGIARFHQGQYKLYQDQSNFLILQVILMISALLFKDIGGTYHFRRPHFLNFGEFAFSITLFLDRTCTFKKIKILTFYLFPSARLFKTKGF